MNIFEFLGLPALHRKDSKVTQLVKHYEEVVTKHKENKSWGLQTKKDGVCAITVISDSKVGVFSRTGKAFTSTDNIIESIKKIDFPDGVYFGEWWVPKEIASLEIFSGIVNPNRVKPLNQEKAAIVQQGTMSWFDSVSIEEFMDGASKRSFADRHQDLTDSFEYADSLFGGFCDDIEVLEYATASTDEEINLALKFLVSGGEEGIVICNLEADWLAGHKGWRKMKLVRGVDYDLLCIGWEEGTGKYEGKVANLIFNWKDGKTIKAMLGKGWTHNSAEAMFQAIEYSGMDSVGKHPNDPVGQIFQVYALEESSKGKLRLPKVGEKRFDKTRSDIRST